MLENTDSAIQRHSGEYQRLKTILGRINSQTIDVGEYHCLAKEITELMDACSGGLKDTLFHYFRRYIDPDRGDPARFFRFHCLDLQNRIKEVDRYRKDRRNLKVVK